MIEGAVFILLEILTDLNLITEEEALRAADYSTFAEGLAQTGVEILGRHYIISVEDVSS